MSERGSPAFTFNTLGELGAFYHNAIEVNDCSIGEPVMNKDFGRIITQIDRDGKQFSLTTNGQLLTPRIRRELLGKNLLLYVSIDSATAGGYARYRNDRFDDIIDNVTALCREKKAHGDLPRVFVSFIAMRSNVDELPQFFALMRQVGVDEVKLRSLYLDDNLAPVTVNGDYSFDYAAEVLHMDEMAAVAAGARSLAAQHGVPLYVESDQFPVDAGATGAPLCSEPWRTLYILRRGIMPCCYATEPIATWSQRQDRPLEEFLRDVVNSSAMQEIRGELAEGRLAGYCRSTPSCPILKNMQQVGLVAGPRNVYQQRALDAPAVDEGPKLPWVPIHALSQSKRSLPPNAPRWNFAMTLISSSSGRLAAFGSPHRHQVQLRFAAADRRAGQIVEAALIRSLTAAQVACARRIRNSIRARASCGSIQTSQPTRTCRGCWPPAARRSCWGASVRARRRRWDSSGKGRCRTNPIGPPAVPRPPRTTTSRRHASST